MKRITMLSFFGFLVAITIGFSAPSALAGNKVLSLDGDGDYMLVGKKDAFNTKTLTMELWFNIIASDKPMTILWNGDTTGGRDPFWLYTSDGKLFNLRLCFSEVDVYLKVQAHSSGCHHIAFVIDDSTKTASFYLDGILEDWAGFTGISVAEFNHLAVGAYADGGGTADFMKGFIDEVRFWNVARTQEQIQETMHQPLENPELLENLVGYWNFDDGTANDLSQYDNDGVLYGDAYIADVIYVSSEYGSPTGDGTKEHPYDTIQRGIDESGRKDVVQVMPGIYKETIKLLSDLIVLGSGAENTTITAASGNIVTANNVHNVTLSGFTIDGQGSADNGILCSGTTSEMEISNNVIIGTSMVGIGCLDSVNVDIKDNTIEKNGIFGIRCGVSAHATIENNIIRQNVQAGVECSDSTDIIIYNNNLEDNMLRGVQCNGNAKVSIMNNIIRRNQDRGFSCWNTANVTLQYNVISENNWAAYCTDSSVVNITDNLIYNNLGPEIVLAGSSNTIIIRNIIHNNNDAIHCHETAKVLIGGSLTNSNNIVAGVAIRNWAFTTINATYNYWGTTDESKIAAMMKNEGEGSIVFKPFINTLDEIVADVSGDGTISAYDAALILQFVVGLIDTFPVSIPKSPDQIIPRNYTVSLPSLAAHAGKRIQAPVAINDTNDLFAGGIILTYDPTVLKAVDVLPTTTLNGSYWKANTKLDGEIRFAFAFTSVSEEIPQTTKSLFMVEFEVLPNTIGKVSPLILDKVQFSESQNISKINGSVVVLPERPMLLQNYPNPFNPDTWIPYQLAIDSTVMISIYNSKGQLIRFLHLGNQNAGIYMTKDKAAYWDGKDSVGERVGSGVYFYTLQVERQRNPASILRSGEFRCTRKMVIMK